MTITHSFSTAAAERVAYRKVAARTKTAVHRDLHPAVYKLFVGCWAALTTVFVATFAESPYTLYLLGVVIGTGIMFFGVPYVISRQTPQTKWANVTLGDFLRGQVQTMTGPVGGIEAVTQVLMVPVCLTLGAIAISFIVHLEADHIHTLYVAQSVAYPQ